MLRFLGVGGGGGVASTVLDHVTGGLCLLFILYMYMPGSLLQVLWSWYLASFFIPCVFCALIIMIASGSLVTDIKVSWGDRWGAGAEVGSVEWWILFWSGGGACFFGGEGVGLRKVVPQSFLLPYRACRVALDATSVFFGGDVRLVWRF